MTISTLQNKSSAPSFTNQSKNSTSFALQDRDTGSSVLLQEDGFLLEQENGGKIILEQSVIGDMWNLQSKT